jgi:hypothetical protein
MTALNLTALEELLSQAGASQQRDDRLQRLDELATRLRQQLQASVARSEYPAYAAAAEAVQAAQAVLRAWPMPDEGAPNNFPQPAKPVLHFNPHRS